MSALTVKQRQALRYALTQREGDREVFREALDAEPSAPTLRRFIESAPGQVLLLIVGLAIFSIFAPVGIL